MKLDQFLDQISIFLYMKLEREAFKNHNGEEKLFLVQNNFAESARSKNNNKKKTYLICCQLKSLGGSSKISSQQINPQTYCA